MLFFHVMKRRQSNVDNDDKIYLKSVYINKQYNTSSRELLTDIKTDNVHILHIYGSMCAHLFYLYSDPVRIRVRIDPPQPLVCRKRRLNGAVLRMRPEKPRSRVTAGVAR
jgi:hypothetical protein